MTPGRHPFPHPFRAAACAVAALALAACGGGGGGGGDDGASVAGTLTVSANLVVDSDTNDTNQTRVRNDTAASAQLLSASSQAMGTVNQPGSGPQGANYDAGGDISDFYRVTLAAGQTLQLDFTADPRLHDLDLEVFRRVDGLQVLVGESFGEENAECVRIGSDGEYWIRVFAYRGASLYNLRIAAAGAGGACQNATSAVGEPRVLPGRVIAGLADGSGRAAAASALAAVQPLALLQGRLAPGHVGLLALPAQEKVRRRGLLALTGASADEVRAARRPAWMDELSDDSRLQVETLEYAKRLRASGAFDHVMPDRPLRASALVGSFPPNDPRYSLQRWHYEQISLPTAMQTLLAMSPQPTRRPIVAVLDTGIVASHPEFAGQWVAGYDFIRDAASSGDGDGLDPNPDDPGSDAAQPSFHGTHVAGTIAAATFNGDGVAGAAPMAQLMPLRVLGPRGEGSFYDVLQALRYAARLPNDSGGVPPRRADVANLSLGGVGYACDAGTAEVIAQARAKGTMIVAAAGNESDRDAGRIASIGYPANCSGVLAVTATNAQRGVAYYANGGSALALAAPGGDMRVRTTGSGLPDGIYSTLATFEAGGARVATYGQHQGTSMATPHVAAVLALMRWVHPDIAPAQVDALLQQGRLSDDQGDRGHDADFGWGIVNAAKAVREALALAGGGSVPEVEGVLEAQPSSLDFGTGSTRLEFTLRATAGTGETVTAVVDDSAAVRVEAVAVDSAGIGRYRVTVDRGAVAAGLYTPTVTVTTSRRTLTVALSFEKLAAPAAVDIGPIYLLVHDAATGERLAHRTLRASGGRYRYRVDGLDAASVHLIAGSDYDNDGVICSRGEACGAWPVLGAGRTPADLSRDRGELDFVLSPVDVGNASVAAASRSSDASGAGR